jgi:hypothetical protein
MDTPLAEGLLGDMRMIADSSADEMVAHFLLGELTSERWGQRVREALAGAGLSERLVTDADLTDEGANSARRTVLGTLRGYGQERELFDQGFPTAVHWIWAELTPAELVDVRYVEYSYWNELSGGSRLPRDAANRIRQGVRAFGVSNDRFIRAANALAQGARFPPMILAGTRPDALVCLEGHLRLTAHALAAFPVSVECLVGTAADLGRWAQ